MIVDRLENAAMYYPLGERIETALKFIRQEGLIDLEPGRYDIAGKPGGVTVGQSGQRHLRQQLIQPAAGFRF